MAATPRCRIEGGIRSEGDDAQAFRPHSVHCLIRLARSSRFPNPLFHRTSDRMTSSLELTCRACGTAFAYTQAEREFRASRGLGEPQLCPACRSRDRARRNSDLISLYERVESFEPFLLTTETTSRSGASRVRTEHRTQYTAICAACGSETRVPFVPRGDRPVYCRACYNARRGR